MDAHSAKRLRVGETAPPDLLVPLGRLGLKKRFRNDGHAPCPGSSALWGRDRVGHNDAIVSAMGPTWRLDRPRFDCMLADAALEAGAQLRWNTRFDRMLAIGDGHRPHRLQLSGPAGFEEIETTWVIDATGPGARLARALGAERVIGDRLFALVRTFELGDAPLNMRTLIEATPTGWWYTARLPDARVLTMFVTDSDVLRNMGPRIASWNNALAETRFVGPTLATARLDLEPKSSTVCTVLPVSSSILEPLEGAGWLAVGDAASSYDPIAAQGLYKALDDGVNAGRQVARTLGLVVAGREVDRPARVRARYREYCDNRAYLYTNEQRWRSAGFWARRNGTRASRERALGTRSDATRTQRTPVAGK